MCDLNLPVSYCTSWSINGTIIWPNFLSAALEASTYKAQNTYNVNYSFQDYHCCIHERELQDQEASTVGCSCSRAVWGDPTTSLYMWAIPVFQQIPDWYGTIWEVPRTGQKWTWKQCSVHQCVMPRKPQAISLSHISSTWSLAPSCPSLLLPLFICFSVVSLILDYLLQFSSLVYWDLHGITFFKLKKFFYMNGYCAAHVSCAPLVCLVTVETRTGHCVPRMELWMVVIHHVSAWNWTWLNWKQSQGARPLTHLSSPVLL